MSNNSLPPHCGAPLMATVYVRFSQQDFDDVSAPVETEYRQQEEAMKDFCRKHGLGVPLSWGDL